MRISLRIKPRQVKDSLLVYSAQTEDGLGDFSSLTIKDKRIEFRFDSGSGMLTHTIPVSIALE